MTLHSEMIKKHPAANAVAVALLFSFSFLPGVAQAHNLQICKLSDQSSPVTGTFNFTVAGQNGSIPVAAGACFTIPDIGIGSFTVIEQPSAGTTVASIAVDPVDSLVASDAAIGSATVTVADGSTTTVTFTNRATSSSPSGLGRFTGGGSIFTSARVRVTHGFELHCSPTDTPNRLEVNWGKSKFHLESLTSASCSVNPTTKVATIIGTGSGSYNGVTGATIAFTFTDAGEPGRSDFASYVITDFAGNVVLSSSGTLTEGNHQYHPH